MNKIQEAKNILKKYNQYEIYEILEKIDKENKEKLANQILEIDFDKLLKLYNNRNGKEKKDFKIEPIDYIDKSKLTEEEKEEYSKIGEEIIENEQYAVVTMAGGQGTRLGWKGPKGTFKLYIGENGKYIFEILVDSLKRAKDRYGKEVYWYIMTSEENNKDTIDFFEEHNYFGYTKEKVKFFIQDCLEMISEDGNLLITNKYEIKKASNGNGSIYKALQNTGMIEDMKNKSVKWVYICGVDNIMANMVDTVLLGLTIKNKMSSASKSVKKSNPEEKVGLFCKKNGRPAIVEYIDMSEKDIYARKDDGELVYGESNILGHLFNIEAIEKLASFDLKYHCAHKKCSYMNNELKEVVPKEPNAYKFEAFIFDNFEYLDDMLILRVKREDEFAPIKNAEGTDSPQTAKKLYIKFLSS